MVVTNMKYGKAWEGESSDERELSRAGWRLESALAPSKGGSKGPRPLARVQALDGSTQTSKGRSLKKEITREGPNKLLTLEPRPEMDILDQQLSKMS